ncbi:MAG: MmgE/PrpD family protein [Alphaproteobacteria bacterium]|nr:MmgE/PrpD family protein [Alphaproteobacteria bacterium]
MSNDAARKSEDSPQVTREISEWTARFANRDVTPSARTWATHTLLDWAGVTVAGAREPLAQILTTQYAEDDGPCTVIATGKRARAHDAAMLNGSAGHALDYDDVNASLHGHPSVPVAPVVLALGETLGATGEDVIRAFIAGYEVECAIGSMAGDEHYNNGFHATGTMGTFGAAAAAANLMGLNAEQTMNALGIAATQASGIKSMFGTMTKPFHAGKAAMNGLIAAQIAAKGFTAGKDAIECQQGFMDVAAPGFQARSFSAGGNVPMEVEKNLFKYHASCYLTHSTIEAVAAIRRQHEIDLDDLKELKIFMAPASRKVCDIPDPDSGLEIKFSIRHLAAMALDGVNTAALESYTDETAKADKYAKARQKITIVEKELSGRHAGAVSIETTDGRTMVGEVDVGRPATDVEEQWRKLEHKARTIMRPGVGDERTDEIVEAIASLADAPSIDRLMAALT